MYKIRNAWTKHFDLLAYRYLNADIDKETYEVHIKMKSIKKEDKKLSSFLY